MFLEGLKAWFSRAGVEPPEAVDLVLFSNLSAKGELTLVHNHNADLVGIYYVRTASHDGPPVLHPGEDGGYFEPGDGVLVLHDPRFNANLAATGDHAYVKVAPRPGLMLIFPAYVWHSVTPHLGPFRRLALSMNFTMRWQGGSVAQRVALT